MEHKSIAVVTGANGFVGSHLVDYLLENNMEVRCIVRNTSNLQWLKGKDVKMYDSGLFNKAGLVEIFKGANYIFHAAGVVKSKEPEGYYMGNVETTKTILEAALDVKETIKKIVIVSSGTVCGPVLNGNPADENTVPKPITTYGRSKLEQEKVSTSYMDRLPITICRAAAVYGERDTEIFIFFSTFNKGLMTTIGLKDKKVSLVHVNDLVRGFYLAALNKNAAGNIYFISSERGYTWKEIGDVTSVVLKKKPIKVKVPHSVVYVIAAIAQFFAMFSSKPATLNLEKARDIVQPEWTFSIKKAKRELGYCQEITLEEGIKRTCEWYKKMNWLK